MVKEDIHLSQLIAINQLIREGKIDGEDGALLKFKFHLDSVESFGPFDLTRWHNDWRIQIREFGKLIQNRNPNQFLNIINEKMRNKPVLDKEVIEFIKSEIDINFLPAVENSKRFEHLTQEYPFNPEFRYELGSSFAKEENLIAALEEYKIALKIDPANNTFLETRFSCEQQYLDNLIEADEFEAAERHLRDLFSDTDFIKREGTRSTFADYARKIKDYRFVEAKVKELETEFKDKMHLELDHERRRLIGIFGFFTAIVAFLLSTVSIGENFSFIEALYFIIALGIILILFVTSLFTVFTTERTRLIHDKTFWILITGLVLLFLLIINAESISKIIEQLIKKY